MFATKTAQKEAMNKVTRKYEELVKDVVKAAMDNMTKEQRESKEVDELYWSFPTPNTHKTLVKRWLKCKQDVNKLAELETLANEYQELKAAPITQKQKSLEDLIEEEVKNINFKGKKEDEVSHSEIVEILKKFKIDVAKDYAIYTATRHTVVNAVSGKVGIRTFYYLNGKLVKLNYLIAVLTKRAENEK